MTAPQKKRWTIGDRWQADVEAYSEALRLGIIKRSLYYTRAYKMSGQWVIEAHTGEEGEEIGVYASTVKKLKETLQGRPMKEGWYDVLGKYLGKDRPYPEKPAKR